MMALASPLHPWQLVDLVEGFATGQVTTNPTIGSMSLDSRTIEPGGLFLACRGSTGHGLEFAAEAQRRGASAIAAEPAPGWDDLAMARLTMHLRIPLVQVPDLSRRASALAHRFYGEPSADLNVIGVTGTNGKTSVTHFLAQTLGTELTCGIVGTLGAGFPGDLAAGSHTTPDPVRLQETLAWLRSRGARAVAMEVSSHALAQGRAEAVRFSHAVLTNLSRDHLDYHGDMTSYGAAKRRLFRMPGLAWAVLNQDEPLSREILSDLDSGVSVAWYSLNADAKPPQGCDLWLCARALTLRPMGFRVSLASSAGEGELEVGLLGRFNAANLMAVLAVALSRGLSLEHALRELAQVYGVPGRMEPFGGGDAPQVVIDYAHTPDALEQALTNLREHTSGRLICVFGCGGERDRGKRPLMGSVAQRLSDQVIVTDDNPRSEDGDAIVAEILSGMGRLARVRVERRRALAIRAAIAAAGADDLVLIAGKGHETTQDLGDLKIHFSDRAQVVQALREREGLGA